MRIISGKNKGIIIHAPHQLPVRPTTDRAKESLFNILENYFNTEQLNVLDLFSGTGNITYEFASRGALAVLSIDANNGCVKFIKETVSKLRFDQVEVRKADVFRFLKETSEQFDIIFADPPYALPAIPEIPVLVRQNNLLKPGGWLIIEHGSQLSLEKAEGFTDMRKYGQSTFSFFKNRVNSETEE